MNKRIYRTIIITNFNFITRFCNHSVLTSYQNQNLNTSYYSSMLCLCIILFHWISFLFLSQNSRTCDESSLSSVVLLTRKQNRHIIIEFGAGQTANKLFGIASAIVISKMLNIPIACKNKSLDQLLDGTHNFNYYMDIIDCNGRVKEHRTNYTTGSRLFSLSNGCFYETNRDVQNVINQNLNSLVPSGDILVRTNCPFFKWLAYHPENRRRLVQLGLLSHMNMSVDEMHQQIMSKVLQHHILFKPIVQEIIDANEKMFRNYSLCIHIRTKGPNFLLYEDLPNVIQCINDHHINISNVFICSDNFQIQSAVGNMLPPTSTKSYENGHWSFKTLNRNGQAILFAKMKLLSMCQTYLGTLHSTWSYTNALFSNGKRFFIGHNDSCSNIVSF